MPSPFPGMDPYLESPRHWGDVHLGLISEIQAQLNRQLRPRYHVRVEERVYVSDENDPGSTSPVLLTTMIEDEIHEARLEIIDSDQRAVITVIEILSPTNKFSGSRGRASYEQKRKEVMTSSSHFVEIDLLRNGEHLHCRELLPRGDYFVHVSKKDIRPKDYVWPIQLPQRLPTIAIPLKSGDEDTGLDLQAVLNTAYERGTWDMVVDYRSEPVPSLSAEAAIWADRLLRAVSVR